MKSNNLTALKFFLTNLYVFACSNIPAMAQRPQQSVELTKLISMYMLPSGVRYNVLDWSTGSEPGTPIYWSHAGIKDCDRFALEVGTEKAFCRTGNVVVAVAGKPTYTTLNRVVEPGKWKVTLGGSRAGVDYIKIDADTLSGQLDSQILVTAANSTKSGVRLRQISRCGSSQSSGAVTFSISAPGKRDALIRQWWSCGSGGCNVILSLVPDRDNRGDADGLTRCDS